MSKRITNILLSASSILLGGIIYLCFRETTIVASVMADMQWVKTLQDYFASYRVDFLRYYFVDFLWSFSLCTGLIAIYVPKGRGLLLCGFLAFGYGCMWELLQWLRIVTGTGDLWDIAMYLFASVFGVYINNKERIR